MDGPSLINFTVSAIPGVIDQILKRANLNLEQIDMLLMHQATLKMLSMLQQRIGVAPEKMPIRLEDLGNTVSSTIPILIHGLRTSKDLRPDMKTIMLGFGVGWSWAGCLWQDIWSADRT